MSSPAGTCCEPAYLSAHQAMPTFVVGNNSGLFASVYVSGGRLWGLQPLQGQSILGCVSIRLSVVLFL